MTELKECTAYETETGEEVELEKLFQDYIRNNKMRISKKSESINELMEKITQNPLSLNLEQIQKIAKYNGIPLESFNRFTMINLSECYLDVELSSTSRNMFHEFIKLMRKGNKVDKYTNNKNIKSMQEFYDNLGMSRATFYRTKKELEDKRLIKIIETIDRMLILFNPVYVRCGKIESILFQEFEEEIKINNPLEWLFLKKKHENSGVISLKSKTAIIYKDKNNTNDLQSSISK